MWPDKDIDLQSQKKSEQVKNLNKEKMWTILIKKCCFFSIPQFNSLIKK